MYFKPRNLEELNIALRNSFQAIKKDMTNIKNVQGRQVITLNEFQRRIDALGDFVSIDKLNLVKVKIGDLNEEIKKLSNIKEDVSKLSSEKISKVAMDKEIKDINKKISKHIKKSNKKVSSLRTMVYQMTFKKERILKQDLDKHMKVLNKKINTLEQQTKDCVIEAQVEKLINDINREFDALKEKINGFKDLKNTAGILKSKIDRKDFDQKTDELNASIEEVKEDMLDSKEKFVSISAVNELKTEVSGLKKISYKQLNPEISRLKEEIARLKEEAVKIRDKKEGRKKAKTK